MQNLIVTLIQTELHWEDIPANLGLFDKKIDAIEDDTDLVILPEMFSTGFTMNAAECAEGMNGSAVTWLREKSASRSTDMVGSVIIEEDGKYYNRLVWAKPHGAIYTYDKEHLFRLAGEEKIYSTSHRKVTVPLKGWRIRPFICYDLRFPIWTRNLEPLYDLAIFIANWPEKRSAHWRLLLQARAVENLSYVVGVNRVGKDGNGYPHRGDSAIIDPQGRTIFEKSQEECVFTGLLDREAMETYRRYFPAWMDADSNLVLKG